MSKCGNGASIHACSITFMAVSALSANVASAETHPRRKRAEDAHSAMSQTPPRRKCDDDARIATAQLIMYLLPMLWPCEVSPWGSVPIIIE